MYSKGQRWVSEYEPELGVGVIVDASPGQVSMLYGASGVLRQYATETAPLKRVTYATGDSIRLHTGEEVPVSEVETTPEGLLIYLSEKRRIPETELSDTLVFSKPEEKLFVGQVEDPAAFSFRLECLRRRCSLQSSPVHGFIGAKITLLPHQIYTAQETASRPLPRVLLADEVGLGKTIEACLILHRLYCCKRASRILILVPEPLTNQWFVELFRRFSMCFQIFDEDRCLAIEGTAAGGNPFAETQLAICSIGWLAENETRAKQASSTKWDLLVVDEAQHLRWSQTNCNKEYAVAEELAKQTPGVLLLSATPEQLGPESHFARLRLLDPARYSDFQTFEKEKTLWQKTAKIAAKLLASKPLTQADAKLLTQSFPGETEGIQKKLTALKQKEPGAYSSLLSDLLDLHGPGRVIFRNTRFTVKGFPKRVVHLYPLTTPAPQLFAAERIADNAPPASQERKYGFSKDPRTLWLTDFLKKQKKAKILLICRTKEKLLALDAALREKINRPTAVFHEGLSLLQRDRNAAWFAEEDGAQILLCSEIGSEGRNFQFAHHLVLFDLPEHPDVLEQRIGRLDRIGQHSAISIHVPYPAGTYLEILARWYHESLNAFEKPFAGGLALMQAFGEKLNDFLQSSSAKGFDLFLKNSAAFHEKVVKDLEQGQDLLLQMNSCRPKIAEDWIGQIRSFDSDLSLDRFLQSTADSYNLSAEETSPRTWLIAPTPQTPEALPGLPETGSLFTCDRNTAQHRDDLPFLTWEHPFIGGIFDLVTGSGKGCSSFAICKNEKKPGIFLEAIFLVEPQAPPEFHIDRFLPATPILVVADALGNDVTEEFASGFGLLEPGSIFPLLDTPRIKNKILPSMLAKCRSFANAKSAAISAAATQKMRAFTDAELLRIKELQKINDHVRQEEVLVLEERQQAMTTLLQKAPVRLDALRLVWQNPGN